MKEREIEHNKQLSIAQIHTPHPDIHTMTTKTKKIINSLLQIHNKTNKCLCSLAFFKFLYTHTYIHMHRLTVYIWYGIHIQQILTNYDTIKLRVRIV